MLRRALAGSSSLFLAGACGCPAAPRTPPATEPPATAAAVGAAASDLEPRAAAIDVDASALRAHVEALAADAMAGRPTPSAELDAAAEYIAGQYRELGLEPPPGAGDFRIPVPCSGDRPSANVVGHLPGSDPDLRRQAVVVSAHYDHIGRAPSPSAEGDAIFNGANDNASGVAAMLEIARALPRRPAPPRSVVFIAFCGEERGLVGSGAYVTQPAWPLEDTVAGINLEMLGRPGDEHPRRLWVTGWEYSDLGARMAEAAGPLGVEVVSARLVGPQEGEAFNRSDNYPLARGGVVAHTFSTGKIDAYYHSVEDEAENLDFAAMAPLVEALATGVAALARTPAPPDWSDEGRRWLEATRSSAQSEAMAEP